MCVSVTRARVPSNWTLVLLVRIISSRSSSSQNLGQVEVFRLPDLVLARPVDGDVVVNDGVLVTRRVHAEHYALLLLKIQ